VYGRSLSRRILSPFDLLVGGAEMRVQVLCRARNRGGTDAGVTITRMALGGGGMAQRTRELLSDGDDDVILYVQEAGRRIVSQLGREATVGPAGGVLVSNADTGTIVVPDASRLVGIGLPRRLMRVLAPGLEDAFIRPLTPATDALRLLRGYLGIVDDEHALSKPELRRAVAAHIHDLCALAIGATRDAAEIARGRGLRAARLRAIKADIAQNLAHGDVSASALALRQRVTPRYIGKLFESEGTTLSQFVLCQRLAQVHRMLSDPRHRHQTISTIAYNAGFNDLSTFNRAFRRHFSATPSDVRAGTQR
jgi:AraC-like DNA-binding protein